MKTITVPDQCIPDFRDDAGDKIEIRDQQGNVLGRYQRILLEIPAGFELSADEKARRLSPDAKTLTTAELLEFLKGRIK